MLLWYQAKGMRSQAVRGAAWERPVRDRVSFIGFARSRRLEESCCSSLEEGWGRTVRAAVVEEDVCVRVRLALVSGVSLRDCDLVLVALAGA